MMLGVDLDEIHSIDPSYNKGIHTIVIATVSWVRYHQVLASVTEWSNIIQ